MAFLQIDSATAIKSEPRSWTICCAKKRIDDKTGRHFIAWEPFAWYPTLDGCVQSLIEYKLRCSEATTISELAHDLAEITINICRELITNKSIDDVIQLAARSPELRRQFSIVQDLMTDAPKH